MGSVIAIEDREDILHGYVCVCVCMCTGCGHVCCMYLQMEKEGPFSIEVPNLSKSSIYHEVQINHFIHTDTVYVHVNASVIGKYK